MNTTKLKRIFSLFKKTHGDNHSDIAYPQELVRLYKVSKKTLGVGSFAVVKECIHRETKKQFALKIILKKFIEDILKQVRHPNIVSMHALYETKEAVYIITDLASGGELFQQILSKGSYTESDACHLIYQVLKGLAYLHEHDANIKPENTTDENANLMITDFGLSKILKNHDDILTTACGTPGYVAPEVLLQKGYGRPVDLWSVGVITFILLAGYTPFYGSDQAELFSSILKGEYSFDEEYWGDISDSAKNFIDGLLAYKPEKRLTAEEALSHSWITQSSENGSVSQSNLMLNIRKGLNSFPSFKSTLDNLSQWNELESTTITNGDNDVLKKSKKEEKKPKRKSLIGKHLKTGIHIS
ncbi:kinase-like domain-containing protein [Cunninghamella echinulata]|nr:kinase-like domain-containing protein [Cunninghamella echinulata]